MPKTLVICAGPWMGLPPTVAPAAAGYRLLVFGQGEGGIGSSHFSALGAKVGGSVRSLAGSRGVDLDEFPAVALVGFSAAHGLFESLLRGPDAPRVTLLHAADAYYTGPGLEVKRGYRAFLERAVAGDALAVLTSSNIAGPGYPSGSAAVAKLVDGLELDPVTLAAELPPPERALVRRGCIWADYALRFKHPEHATKLAPLWWSQVERAYLEHGQAPPAQDGGFDPIAALSALGLLWALNCGGL